MLYAFFKEEEVKGLQSDFVKLLDIARCRANVPFIITSGFRTEEENARIGGVKNSKHLTGEAVDLRIQAGMHTARIIEALLSIPFFEVVIEKDHIHVEFNEDLLISRFYIRYA